MSLYKPEDCNSRSSTVRLGPQSSGRGYIALDISDAMLPKQCSLQFQPPQGMKVNITMYSFLPPPKDEPLTTSSACYEVGVITEGPMSKTVHKCLNDPRLKVVYLSNGGYVDITLASAVTMAATGTFMFHYEGNKVKLS